MLKFQRLARFAAGFGIVVASLATMTESMQAYLNGNASALAVWFVAQAGIAAAIFVPAIIAHMGETTLSLIKQR